MWLRANQKIVGAFVVGVAMVAGAYTIAHFGNPRLSQPGAVQAAKAPPRISIAVSDNDQNGVEDWRDAFVSAESVIIEDLDSPYTPPDTVTGKLGITFFEDIIRSKNYGPLGRSQNEVITDAVNELSEETNQTLFGMKDVSIFEDWNDDDIRNYGNSMAGVIMRNNKEGMDSELVILNDIMVRGKTERLAELKIIASVYKSMRDESLLVPVPKLFLKQHLDLINTYEAIYKDIYAMTLSLEDPAVALLRIKRYEDDSLGLSIALENMYGGLEPYAGLFSADDPALLFANFNQGNLVQR
jgi:hypothetical protein